MTAREDIFFIAGEMKSGTTWLMHLLDACPGVTCRGEDQFGIMMKGMADLMTLYNQHMDQERQRYPSAAKASLFSQDDLPTLTKAAIQRLVFRDVPDDEIAGSKYRSIYEHMDMYLDMFPAGKIIHIVRDPRDVTVSYHHFSENFLSKVDPEFKNRTWQRSANVMATSWTSTINILRQAKERKPEAIHEIRYEDLKADTTGNLAEVLAFLGADARDDALAAAVETASFKKLSGGRTEGQEDSNSFYRKGVSGDWREKMDADVLSAFEGDEIRHLMGHFGYE